MGTDAESGGTNRKGVDLMQYVGSKNRISKHIAPIIESYLDDSTSVYIEPFVGGANMIDKINFPNKVGYDSHEFLIALLTHVGNGGILPDTISEAEYKRIRDKYREDNLDDVEDWYVGLVGFCASFGAKWFGGFARGFKNDGVTPRDIPNEAIRNIRRQAPNIEDVTFIHSDFRDIKAVNAVIYCDPPYANTTRYRDAFPHGEFWAWVRRMSENNIVLVSEYDAPSDFEVIWEMPVKTSLGSGVNKEGHQNRVERLFKLREAK